MTEKNKKKYGGSDDSRKNSDRLRFRVINV